MAEAAFDYQQVTDLFAIAGSQRFTGSMTFHFSDGQPKDVELHWKLTFGDKVMKFIRIMRGRSPPSR